MKKTITLPNILLLCTVIIISSTFLSKSLYCQNKIIAISAKADDKHENIQYRTINENEIINFSDLIRIYINKSSVTMVDMEVVRFDSIGNAVEKKLTYNIRNKYGDITSNTIVSSEQISPLLIKKSIYTSKNDFKLIMNMLNKTIWSLQDYYSSKLYSTNYNKLTQKQKDNINKLVPLQNYLAKDNEY